MLKYAMIGMTAVVLAGSGAAQEPLKPGPEHKLLEKLAGEWTMVMTSGGKEFKAASKHEMTLGGLWLSGTLEGKVEGRKYEARRLDGYDPVKKKYVNVWVDSDLTSPVVTEGTYDAATKTLTQTGEGPGFDGKPMKHTWITTFKTDDAYDLTIRLGDVKEPALTVAYKRKN